MGYLLFVDLNFFVFFLVEIKWFNRSLKCVGRNGVWFCCIEDLLIFCYIDGYNLICLKFNWFSFVIWLVFDVSCECYFIEKLCGEIMWLFMGSCVISCKLWMLVRLVWKY